MAFCEQCGHPIGENAKFCRNCGYHVEGIGVRVPLKVIKSEMEDAKERKETLISRFKKFDWKEIWQKGMSTVKQCWASGIMWSKQKISALWYWKWGKSVVSAAALVLVIALVLPLFTKNEPVGVCSNCGNVVAKKAYECTVCGVEFNGEYTILAFSMAEVTLPATEFDPPYEPEAEKEDVFVPDYRPGYENAAGILGSNWANGCHITEQDGWIYYSFWGGLYKMPINGTKQDVKKLFDENVNYVNVVGDWIYCTCYAYPDNETSVLRIRTDGAIVEVLSATSREKIVVMDGFVYYYDTQQKAVSTFLTTLYRMNLETLEKEVFLNEGDSAMGDMVNFTGTSIGMDCGEFYYFAHSDGRMVAKEGDVGLEYHRYDEDGEPAYLDITRNEWLGGWEYDYYFELGKWGEKIVTSDEFGPVREISESHMCLANFREYVVVSDSTYDPIGDVLEGTYLFNSETGAISKINDDRMDCTQYAGGYLYYCTPYDDGYPEYRCKLDGSDWSKIDWMCP